MDTHLFTDLLDIDGAIIMLLDLQDVQQVFLVNKYAKQLYNANVILRCKMINAKQRAQKMKDLNRSGYVFMFKEEQQPLPPISKILKYLKIVESKKRNMDRLKDELFYDLHVNNRDDDLWLMYIESIIDGDELAFYISNTEFQNFLFHLFYNDLLVLI